MSSKIILYIWAEPKVFFMTEEQSTLDKIIKTQSTDYRFFRFRYVELRTYQYDAITNWSIKMKRQSSLDRTHEKEGEARTKMPYHQTRKDRRNEMSGMRTVEAHHKMSRTKDVQGIKKSIAENC